MANQAQNTNPTTITSVGTATAGGTANSAKPAIVGTAQPNSTVEIFDGGRLIGIAAVDKNGNWTFAPPSNMSSGVHQFSALAIDTMGVFGPMSTPVSVSIPAVGPVAPLPPVIESVIDAVGPVQGNVPSGGTTDDNHPTISGTGIPGNKIYVYQNGLGCADTVVDSTGHWSVKVTGAMSDGLHNMTATQFPSGGAASVASNTWAITIDTTKPLPPAVPTLTNDSGAAIPAGSTTNDNHPHINGTGKAGDIITVYDGNTVLGSTKVGSNGQWTFTPGNLSAGAHSINVTETNAAGTQSEHSGSIGFIYSNVTPSPVITSVIDAVGPVQGNVPSGGTTDDPALTISGTGVAGDTVYVYLTSAGMYGGKPYGAGTAYVDASGHWSVKLDNSLQSGLNTITATQFVPGGAQSTASAGWVVTLDTSKPAKPAVPVLTDDNGATILAGSTTSDNHPHISGTGKAGDTIMVYDYYNLIGSTTIGSNGKWTFTPTSLQDNLHSFLVSEVTAAGRMSEPSDAISVRVNASVPATPVIYLTDDNGATIPANSTTADNHPHINGTGTAGTTILVMDSGYVIGSTSVGANGQWTYTPSNLSDGLHGLQARAVNAVGTYSNYSNGIVVTVNATAPTAPATPTLTDDNGATIPAGSTTNDNHPHINGTGTAGNIIKVYDGSTVLGSTTVGSNGKWTFTPGNLSVGAHSINVTETNAAGLSSTHSSSTSFIYAVGTAPTETIVITVLVDHSSGNAAVYSGGSIKDAGPEVRGTLSSALLAGETLVVYRDGVKVGSASVSPMNNWMFQDSGLGLGSHFYEARVESSTGYGPTSNHFTFNEISPTPVMPTETVVITNLYDHLIGGNVYSGGSSKDTTPLVGGTLSSGLLAGEAVVVYRDGSKVGNATVSGKSWTFQDSSLGLGNHFYEARVETSTGYGPTSNHFTFSEISPTPPIPAVSIQVSVGGTWLGLNNVPLETVPNGGSRNGDAFNIFGSGVAGAKITIAGDWAGGTTLSTTVDASGFWYVTSPHKQPAGRYSFNVVETVGGVSTPPSNFIFYIGPGPAKVSATHDVAVSSDHADLALTASGGDPDHQAQQPVQHAAVAGDDAFVGKVGNGNETVDLNADPSTYFKAATAHIEGAKGGASDTLHLTGDHQVLDLTSLTGKTSAAKISGIEVVDLGGQHNTLKLSLIDVLNLGETDLFQKDGKQQMMVQGKDGDTVDLSNAHIAGLADGEWAAHGTAVVGGVTYNVYEHSGAHTELLVQQGVQIVVH